MLISNSRPSMRSQKAPRGEAPFDSGVPNYRGPENGLSKSKPFPHATRLVLNAGTSLFCRTEYQNAENLPTSGGHVYSANHCNMLDVPIVLNLPVDDLRLMTTIEAFQSGIAGPLLGMAGAYPVNKMQPSPVTKKHSVDIVKSGVGNFIFPEGRFSEEGADGGVGAFKKGAAAAAILGHAESVVPMAIHYKKNDKLRPLELGAGLALGLGVAAAGLVFPGSSLISTLSGALAGAFVGGELGKAGAKEVEYWNPGPKFLSTLKGRVLGALAGGAVGFLGTGQASALASTAGGLGAFGLAESWRNRPVATVKVGAPIDAGPYTELAKTDKSAATTKLTKELHKAVGELKADLSGKDYVPPTEVITSARPKENFWDQR